MFGLGLEQLIKMLGPKEFNAAGAYIYLDARKRLLAVLDEAKEELKEGEVHVGYQVVMRPIKDNEGNEHLAPYAFVIFMDQHYDIVRRGKMYYIDAQVKEFDFSEMFKTMMK